MNNSNNSCLLQLRASSNCRVDMNNCIFMMTSCSAIHNIVNTITVNVNSCSFDFKEPNPSPYLITNCKFEDTTSFENINSFDFCYASFSKNVCTRKYYVQNITEAGMALDALRKSVHLVTLAANKINQFLNDKLQDAVSKEDIQLYLAMLNNVSSNVKELPNLMKSINVAYENLRAEEEEQLARGGKQILSSMDADEEIL